MARPEPADIEYGIEIRGVYDGISVWVLKDGTKVNRWIDPKTANPYPGYEKRAATVDAYILGEPANGRWY